MSNRDISLWPLALLLCLSFLLCFVAVFIINHFTVLGLNTPFMFWINIFLLVVITAYVLYRVFKKEPTFNQINDKDKYLELIEDAIEIDDKLKCASHAASRNLEKLCAIGKELFPSKEKNNEK